MTTYRFELIINDTVEAETEEEARQAFLEMITQLTPKFYATESDLDLIGETKE